MVRRSDKSKKIVMLKEGLILSLMRSGWLNISSTRSGSALPDRNMMRLALQMLEGLLGKSECRIQVTHKNGVTNGPLSHLFDEFASCFARTFYHGGAAGGYSIEQKVAEEAQTGEARKILDRLTELMEGLKDASNKLVPLEKQLKSSYDRSEDQEDKKWWIDSSRLNCILSLRRSEGLGLLDEMRKAVEKAPTFSETPRLIWKKERDGRSQGGRWEWEGAGESSTGKQKHRPQHFPAKKQEGGLEERVGAGESSTRKRKFSADVPRPPEAKKKRGALPFFQKPRKERGGGRGGRGRVGGRGLVQTRLSYD